MMPKTNPSQSKTGKNGIGRHDTQTASTSAAAVAGDVSSDGGRATSSNADAEQTKAIRVLVADIREMESRCVNPSKETAVAKGTWLSSTGRRRRSKSVEVQEADSFQTEDVQGAPSQSQAQLTYNYWDDDSFSDIMSDDSSSCHDDEGMEVSASLGQETHHRATQNRPQHAGCLSLLECAARVVANHMTCDELDKCRIQLDAKPLERIAFWAFPQDVEKIKADAALTCNIQAILPLAENAMSTKVTDMYQVGFMLVCKVADVKVSITFEKQQIKCTECNSPFCIDTSWCQHVLAAVLFRMKKAKEVCVAAPLMEILQQLPREQLIKLILYSVCDDPVSVLGNIIQHVDSIQDRNSELNTTAGAPDCTYFPTTSDDEETHWDLSIAAFSKKLASDLLDWHFRSFDTYNIGQLKQHTLYISYLRHAVVYINLGHTEEAGRILIAIALTLAKWDASSSFNTEARLDFLSLVERYFSHYILEFSGAVREDMIVAAKEINSSLPESVADERSSLAERPLVTLEDVAGPGTATVLEGRPEAPFHEPLCVSLLPNTTEEYQKLINGTVPADKSRYDEPLSIMMLRFEGLQLWKSADNATEMDRKLCRLGIVILRKLLAMSLQFSVLSETVKDLQRIKEQRLTDRSIALEYLEQHMPDELLRPNDLPRGRNMPVSTSNYTKRTCSKGRKRSGPSDKTVTDLRPPPPPKKRKPSELCSIPTLKKTIFGGSLSKEADSQDVLTFCLTEVCCVVHSVAHIESFLNIRCRQILTSATMRALEFDRTRTIVGHFYYKQMSYKECQWVETCNQELYSCLVTKCPNLVHFEFFKMAHGVYMQAILDHIDFYGGKLPVILIQSLIAISKSTGTLGKALDLSVATITNSADPFQAYRDTIDDEDRAVHLLFRGEIEKAFMKILSEFMQNLSSTEDHDLENLLKVFDFMDTCADVHFLGMMSEQLQQKRSAGNNILDLPCIRRRKIGFYLNYMRLRNNKQLGNSNYPFGMLPRLNDLCQEMGEEFIDLVMADWDDLYDFLGSYHMMALFKNMVSALPEGTPLPESMMEIPFKFFENRMKPGDEVYKWLQFFPADSPQVQKAVANIQENVDNCTDDVILRIAEQEHQRTAVPESDPDVFSEKVHSLILSALRTFKKDQHTWNVRDYRSVTVHSDPEIELHWVFNAFLQKPTEKVLEGTQFKEFLRTAAECFEQNVPEIIFIFTSFEQKPPLKELCTSHLHRTLKQAYELVFMEVLGKCNHTCYNRLVRELNQASLYCVMFMPDGQTAFADILQGIRKSHSGKRKLIRMIDQVFMDTR